MKERLAKRLDTLACSVLGTLPVTAVDKIDWKRVHARVDQAVSDLMLVVDLSDYEKSSLLKDISDTVRRVPPGEQDVEWQQPGGLLDRIDAVVWKESAHV